MSHKISDCRNLFNTMSTVELNQPAPKYREWKKTKEIHPLKYYEQIISALNMSSTNDYISMDLDHEEDEIFKQDFQEIFQDLRRRRQEKS